MANSELQKTVVTGDVTSQLVEILDGYLAELQAGHRPDRDQLLAEHPELAEQLQECLSGIDFLNGSGAQAAPETLGDFGILREVGRGGMGVVYEAEQISLKRRVALKVLLHGGSGPEAAQRFRREAETVAELHHTNIVPIFAIGCEGQQHYYAMQFIEGRSLAEFSAAAERCRPVELAGWALQASEALAHAHQRGVVHRDVKPSNLILDPQGRIWLTDFGLAKRADDVTLSVAGALLGTPRYMSPEQAAAMNKPVDHRTDIYSLGATMYELATGQPIFQAESAHAVISQIINAEPKAIRSAVPGFPRDLETIILKCLAKNPGHRYQSAAELAEDLRAFLDERPIQARRINVFELASRWARRNPLVASLTAALVLALVGGLIATASLWGVAEDRRKTAENNADEAEDERDRAEDRLWDSLYEQARAERLAGNRWRALDLITEARELRKSPLLQQEAIQAISSSGVRLVAAVGPQDIVHYGDTPRVMFSADGSLIATPSNQVPTESGAEVSGVKVWDVAATQLVGQFPCVDLPLTFAFSPTDPLLALAGEDQTVRIVEPHGSTTLATFPGRHPLLFSPDGKLLAFRSDAGVELRDVNSGDVVRQLPEGMPVRFVSPETLLVREDKQVDLWNIDTGELVSSSPEDLSAIWTIELADVAGNGPLVPLRSVDANNGLHKGPISIWDAVKGDVIAELPDVGDVPYSAALPLNASAELFAYPDPRQSYAIQTYDLRLQEFRRPLLAPGTSSEPLAFGRFNRDGTILASQEGGLTDGVRLWNLETGEPIAFLHDHMNPVWSPDGRFLATLGNGRFSVSEEVTQGGNRAALMIYEVTLPVSTVAVQSRPTLVSFSSEGSEVSVQGSTFAMRDLDQTRLRLLSTRADGTGKFAAGVDSMWWVDNRVEIEPEEPIVIERIFPDPQVLELGGVDRDEPGSVQNLAVSPDGQLALVEWERQVPIEGRPNSYSIVHQLELWDLNALERLSVWAERPRRWTSWGVLRFSPDGKRALTTEGGEVIIRDVPSGEIVAEAHISVIVEQRPDFVHTRSLTIVDAAFTSDSQGLICGTEEGRICVVDVAGGEILAEWNSHDGDVTAVAVSPDDAWIVTMGDDDVLRLWDMNSGIQLVSWSPHQNKTTAMQFSPDGRCLVTASADGTVKLWDLPAIREQLAAIELDW